MTGEQNKIRPTSAECLINATLTVMDRIMIHDMLDRASAETERYLNSTRFKYVS